MNSFGGGTPNPFAGGASGGGYEQQPAYGGYAQQQQPMGYDQGGGYDQSAGYGQDYGQSTTGYDMNAAGSSAPRLPAGVQVRPRVDIEATGEVDPTLYVYLFFSMKYCLLFECIPTDILKLKKRRTKSVAMPMWWKCFSVQRNMN